jgi:hypothetical protein
MLCWSCIGWAVTLDGHLLLERLEGTHPQPPYDYHSLVYRSGVLAAVRLVALLELQLMACRCLRGWKESLRSTRGSCRGQLWSLQRCGDRCATQAPRGGGVAAQMPIVCVHPTRPSSAAQPVALVA